MKTFHIWNRSRIFLCLILFFHVALLLGNIRLNFVVIDEAGHVPAGLSHWETGTFHAYNVNPPLARMLAVSPLLAAHARTDYHRFADMAGVRSEWSLCSDFARANGARYFDLVCLARLMGIAWSVLGALLIWSWGRELHGESAGCFGAALWCFDPTILTFAAVVTPDIPAAVSGLAAVYSFWHYQRRPSRRNALFAGLLLGIAQLTKYTMMLLYLSHLVSFLIWRRFGPHRNTGEFSPPRDALIITLAGFIVLNAGYGFKDVFRPLGEFKFVSRTLGGEPTDGAFVFDNGHSGNRFRGSPLGLLPIPVPADYLIGIDVQKRDFESGFSSYLAGEWRNRGWWYYYLYALSVKEPVGLMLLVLLNFALLARGRLLRSHACWVDEAALFVPVGIIFAFVSSQTGFSHHMRYILPTFPFVYLSAGKLAVFLRRTRPWIGVFVLSSFCWAFVSMLLVYPHTLSYFNEFAGGPERGADHLLDSNMDWGQDLLFLKKWLKSHPHAHPLYLAYFQVIDPSVVGIDFALPHSKYNGVFPEDRDYVSKFGPHPGFYAVSVAFIKGAAFYAPDGHGGQYFVTHDEYDYLRRFRPIARAGYSIMIYFVSPDDAAAERRRLGLPPL